MNLGVIETYKVAEWSPGAPVPPSGLNRIAWPTVVRLSLIFLFFALLCWLLHDRGYIGACLGVIVFLTYLGLLNSDCQKAPDVIARFMDLPAGDQIPVSVKIVNGEWSTGKSIGSDLGTITFEGDLLHFEGSKTSFDLPRGIVNFLAFPRTSSGDVLVETGPGAFIFKWQADAQRGRVELVVYKSLTGSDRDYHSAFRVEIKRWMDAEPASHRTITLPPRAPQGKS